MSTVGATSKLDPLAGRTIGDFVIRDKLGEGGFGAIYVAEQPALAREAVIKVLHGLNRAGEAATERFLREARLASRLDHPYAAHIYAFGVEQDGLLWIAMERVRGQPLDRWLETHGPMPLEQFVPLLERICEVVHSAHEQGIIHRDLKPSNVMVVSHAGRYLPKLLDFGIARLMDDRSDEELAETIEDNDDEQVELDQPMPTPTFDYQLTRRGAIMGSPRYMAPEQWVDVSSAGVASDLYALAALSFEALTGRPPFGGQSVIELALAHAQQEVPPLGAAFPVALDPVLARGLAKAPADRYGTALELAAAFRAASGLELGPRESLPDLDAPLRDALIAHAPQPIAEAVAALGAARNAHQAEGAARDCVHVAVRWLGIVALASRTRVGPGQERDAAPVVDALRALRRRGLDDDEWLDLARELCRPFATRRTAHPIPELVGLFFSGADASAPRDSPLDAALAASRESHGTSEDHVRELLARTVPALASFLRTITFVCDYPLIVWHDGRAERWMGARLPRRAVVTVTGTPPEPDRPTLYDRDGHPVISLWPLVQAAAPAPGAPEELFLFEGKGRRGARLTALPRDFERQDESVWPWFGAHLLQTDDDAATTVEAVAPYRGLAAFTASDAGSFFGREREVEAFANRLRAQPLLAVVGPSGAGKSSFVHAGVIPSLPATWKTITLRPGAAPLAALTARLAHEGIAAPDLTNDDALGAALRRYAAARWSTVVLVVDQFEELFTLCLDPAERSRMATMLARAARSFEDPVRVILTLRDDFLVRAAELPALHARIGQGLEILGTPAREDLLRIVTEPARRAGYDFEDKQLPVEMVEAVAGEPGALALLSFSAATLWELRDRHFKQLGRRAYAAMGGVAGALAQHAEATLAAMSAEEQRLCREAFRHLVTAAGTRSVLSRTELRQVLGTHALADHVVNRLIDARLIVASEAEDGERIEIIHETLLIAWPRLVGWRRDDAEGARLRDQLRAAARQWEERGRAGGLLWRDEALAEYQIWRSRYPGALTASEEAFGAASMADAARGRRRRRGVIASAFLVLVVLLGVALRQRARAAESERVAAASEREVTRRLIALNEEQGRQALLEEKPGRALGYLAEALHLGGSGITLEFLIAQALRPLEARRLSLAHEGKVWWIAYTRDGTRVVTASANGVASVWDVATGARLLRLEGHDGDVLRIALSPDGTRIVTAGKDHTARIWETATGRSLQILSHGERVWDAAFSPDGTQIVTASQDETAKVWDVATGRELLTLRHKGAVTTASFSPDGARVITASLDHTAAIWRAHDGRRIASLASKMEVTDAELSADGTRVVTASDDGTARIWDATTGAQLKVLVGHAGVVNHASFSSDGTRVVTASADRTARVWDAASGQLVVSVGGGGGNVLVARFDPSGARLVTATDDGSTRIWDTTHGVLLAILDGHTKPVRSAVFSPDGTQVATASFDGTARIWDTRPDLLVASIPKAKSLAMAAAPPDGKRILRAETAPTMFDRASGARLFTLDHPSEFAAFSADGGRVVTAGEDGVARIWNAANGALITSLLGQGQALTAAEFTADGTRIVTSSHDGVLRIWDSATGRGQLVIRSNDTNIGNVAFSPDGLHIVEAGGESKVAHVWDARSGELVRTLRPDGGDWWVNIAAYSPDGRTIATGLEDGTVRLWDANTGAMVATLEHRAGQAVYALGFARNGALLATAGRDMTIAIWDVERRRLLSTLRGHSKPVYSVAFTDGDRLLVTAGADDVVNLWDVHSDTKDWSLVDRIARCDVALDAHQRCPSPIR